MRILPNHGVDSLAEASSLCMSNPFDIEKMLTGVASFSRFPNDLIGTKAVRPPKGMLGPRPIVSRIGNSNHLKKHENVFCIYGAIKRVIAALTDVKLFQYRVTVQKVTGRLDDPSVKH